MSVPNNFYPSSPDITTFISWAMLVSEFVTPLEPYPPSIVNWKDWAGKITEFSNFGNEGVLTLENLPNVENFENWEDWANAVIEQMNLLYP